MFAVPGAGIPKEKHTASAAGAAELHAPLQAAQTSALTQGQSCLGSIASKHTTLGVVSRHKHRDPSICGVLAAMYSMHVICTCQVILQLVLLVKGRLPSLGCRLCTIGAA